MDPGQQGLVDVPQEVGNFGVLDARVLEQKHRSGNMPIGKVMEIDGRRILAFLLLDQEAFRGHCPKSPNEFHGQTFIRMRVVMEASPESKASDHKAALLSTTKSIAVQSPEY